MNVNVNIPLWHQEVLRAGTPEHVLSAVLDYVVLWKPSELAELPEPCDAARFQEPSDVTDYAAALLQREGEPVRHGTAREALTAFFVVAARRIAEIAASQDKRAQPEPETAET